jgi:nitroreductase
MTRDSHDKPDHFPSTQVNGAPLKPITQVLLDRRATSHFKPDPVPEEYLEAILRFAGQAPSGFNLQPWHFLVLREAESRARLKEAAYNQAKIGEAPVVIVAFGLKGEWKIKMDGIFRESARRGFGKEEEIANTEARVTSFLDNFPANVWLNRHTMIATTTLMLVAEAYGLDTAPMEGFDAEAVKKAFGLPAEAEVVAMVAIGFAREPDKPYGGRLPLSQFVHRESYNGTGK